MRHSGLGEGKIVKILVVDDDEFFYQTLSDLITAEGHEALWARDGEEGVTTAGIERPEVIFLDVMLPGETGYKTCQRLRESPATKDIYIVMMSARGTDVAKTTSLKRGADVFLPKPLDADSVRKLLTDSSGPT